MTSQTTMPFTDLERIYEKLAIAIDRVGPERETIMLAKLVLSLAHRLADPEIVDTCIAIALEDLETSEGTS